MATDPHILELQARKQQQRDDDARALAEGTTTGADLRRENEHFAQLAPDAVLRLSLAEALA